MLELDWAGRQVEFAGMEAISNLSEHPPPLVDLLDVTFNEK